MKRLVIFSLIVAIVTGMAFAEVTVGGYVGAQADVVKGNTFEKTGVDSEIESSGSHSARIQATAQNEEGTFGGVVRVYADGGWHLGNSSYGAYAWAWWKPIDMLRIQGGDNPDGDFGANQIVGWGYHANDAEDYVANHFNHYGSDAVDLNGDDKIDKNEAQTGFLNRNTGFFGGFDTAGFTLSLTPIDRLAINLGLPFQAKAGLAEQVFGNMVAQVTYGIESVGDIAVTFQAGRGYKSEEVDVPAAEDVIDDESLIGYTEDGTKIYGLKSVPAHKDENELYAEPSKIFASFYLSAIENMGLNIGVNFTLPYTDMDDTKIQRPMEAGLGFSYNINEAFNLKARLAATFMGSTTPDGGDANPDPLKLGFGLLPSYDLGIMKVYLNAGIAFTGENLDADGEKETYLNEGDSIVGWHVNPYITKSMGGGTFYFGLYAQSNGLKISGDESDKTYIEWGIPVGIVFAF